MLADNTAPNHLSTPLSLTSIFSHLSYPVSLPQRFSHAVPSFCLIENSFLSSTNTPYDAAVASVLASLHSLSCSSASLKASWWMQYAMAVLNSSTRKRQSLSQHMNKYM